MICLRFYIDTSVTVWYELQGLRGIGGDFNLGYKYGVDAQWGGALMMSVWTDLGGPFQIYCEQKNQVWRTYLRAAEGNHLRAGA